MHLVLACLRQAGDNRITVALPHGAMGGFDPFQKDYVHNVITSLDKSIEVDDFYHIGFEQAFGVSRQMRVGQDLCTREGRRLDCHDGADMADKVLAGAVDRHRANQRADMDACFFNLDAVRRYVHGHGRVIVLALSQHAPKTFINRLLEVNGHDADYSGIVIVVMASMDPTIEASLNENQLKDMGVPMDDETRILLSKTAFESHFKKYAAVFRFSPTFFEGGVGMGGRNRFARFSY